MHFWRYMKLFHTCDVLNPINFDIHFKHRHCFCFLVDTRYTIMSGVTEYVITIECPLTLEWRYMGATASQNTGNTTVWSTACSGLQTTTTKLEILINGLCEGSFSYDVFMTSPCKLMTSVVQHTHPSWCDVSKDDISPCRPLLWDILRYQMSLCKSLLPIWRFGACISRRPILIWVAVT